MNLKERLKQNYWRYPKNKNGKYIVQFRSWFPLWVTLPGEYESKHEISEVFEKVWGQVWKNLK